MSGLEDIKNETVDLEKIPIEEVFQQLKCTREGLTTQEGEDRIQIFGPNKLEEKKESKILKFLGFMWNPLSWVMEAAAIMAIALANGDGRPPDWQDFVGIICLLVINSTISFIEENNAGNAAAALMAGLAPKTKVLRDGKWSEQEAAILVPGDIVSIKLGDIIPADARLLEGDPLKVDQSALTGESLPVTKHPGQEVFSGSTCKQGEIEAVVIATGVHTFFGKAAHLVDSTNQVGHFQKVLTSIGNFCICSIAIGIVIEIIVMYPIQRRKYRDGIDNLLVLLIGGIPIAMPTVLSVTMAIGSHRLSQQGAITKRMTAIEEMAGMDVLCSDKTGTLTLNKLSVDKNLVEVFCKGVEKDQVLLFAAMASRIENQDAIDAAMVGMLADPKAPMTKKKSEAANEDQTRDTKKKSVSAVKSSQKEKPVLAKQVKSSKEEEDLLLDSATDSDYDGDSLSGSLNSDDFDSDVFDSEDDASQKETEGGDKDSSEDELELHGNEDSDDDDEGEQVDSENDEEDGSDEEREVAEESDSSEDEVAPRNTVGDVPLEWYKDEKHIGYDITGKKITKKEKQDKLDSFLANMDDSKNWRKIYDEYNDEEVELTKEESKLIRRMLKGEAPHADFDPYAPYVDWFKWDDAIHPLSSAPEPKRRFIPSKWEAKKVVKYVRAIRKGLIKFDKPEEEPNVYLLWGDDSASDQKSKHLTYIPPPKLKLPGHEESYNPSLEYIPTEEEKAAYELMYEEDRPKFIPKRFTSLRSIPAYENALKESFDRCLDLYLCPRVRKKRINIDPESLKPKLPSRKDLRPYPNSCYLEYKGHTGAVTSVSPDCSGQWIASGSADGSVRIWEVETGRCLKVWLFKEPVKCVAWNPLPDFPILAVAIGQDLVILNTELGTDEEQQKIEELLRLGNLPEQDEAVAAIVSWLPDETYGGIKIKHFKNISYVDWHPRGDYLSAVMSAGETRGVVIHQLSMHKTQRLPIKMRGLPVCTLFHPTHRGMFIIATKKNVRVFNLQKRELAIKKLETGLREISSMAIHPGGDNLIVGSKEGKMCWFDMDLSSKPYKTLKNHPKDITNVAFHRSYPLFASCSEDSTAYVFHGKVYSDLNENPLIVPLEILRGHSTSSNRGVLDCKFHPRQPWLFTAGADSVIKLYCH